MLDTSVRVICCPFSYSTSDSQRKADKRTLNLFSTRGYLNHEFMVYFYGILGGLQETMKKKIYIGLGIAIIVVIGIVGYIALTTRSHSPTKTTEFSDEGLAIKVVYCQPYKKGRVIFGEEKDGVLLPYGKYWRLGANEATEITFSKNINFAGKPINAGTYRMYAVPGASSWEVSLNSELGKWGAIAPDYSLDVLKVEVPVSTAPSETEQFTINFTRGGSGATMDFMWDKTLVSIPITLQ